MRCKALWCAALMFSLCSGTLCGEEHGSGYHIYFSPEDHLADRLIALIKKEKKSIRAAVYCLMDRSIANALIEAHKRGVDVEVITDPFSVKARSPLQKMENAQVPLFVWSPPEFIPYEIKKGEKRKALMHDKFCVFGEAVVWTGSFNFTREANNYHRENAIVFENEEIAIGYLKEFERIKEKGAVPYAEYASQLPARTIKRKMQAPARTQP